MLRVVDRWQDSPQRLLILRLFAAAILMAVGVTLAHPAAAPYARIPFGVAALANLVVAASCLRSRRWLVGLLLLAAAALCSAALLHGPRT